MDFLRALTLAGAGTPRGPAGDYDQGMVFGGIGGRSRRGRGYRGGGYGGGAFNQPYGRRRRGGGCVRDACLLEGGCCLAEGLDGNCLVLTVALAPRLLMAFLAGSAGDAAPGGHRSAGRLVAAIGVYQERISPRLAGRCRFTPSCSQYAAQAVQLHGTARGCWLTLRRLARCRPNGQRGADPVPG